jgi:hypothetical protein
MRRAKALQKKANAEAAIAHQKLPPQQQQSTQVPVSTSKPTPKHPATAGGNKSISAGAAPAVLPGGPSTTSSTASSAAEVTDASEDPALKKGMKPITAVVKIGDSITKVTGLDFD